MKFVLIFGPQATGKMTVGHELEKITNLKLFHNHMTIELVNPFFDYGTKEGKRLVRLFREELFKAMAKSDQEGMIFTYVWRLICRKTGRTPKKFVKSSSQKAEQSILLSWKRIWKKGWLETEVTTG